MRHRRACGHTRRFTFPFVAHVRPGVGNVFRIGVCLLLTMLALLPALVAGQSGREWQLASSGPVTVLMQPNDRLAASSFLDAYGSFAETAIDEISLLLDLHGASSPVMLQVFAEGHVYDAAVESVGRRELDGVIAVADPARSTVLIPLSPFVSLVPFDAENQLRHAIAHVLTWQASEGTVPRGFDEGFARYVERPMQPKMARIASIVQGAARSGSLISWSNMNRTVPLDDDDLIEAQSYAVVGFLLQNHGLKRFQSLLTELRTADSWRAAINLAYAPATSDSLESQWREEIPLWAQGDWKFNLVAGFDLGPARDLLHRGNYNGAANALLVSEQLMSEIDDPNRLAQVSELKDQARIGGLAEAKMMEAQQALENFAYDRAFAAVEQASEQYDQLPSELRPSELIEQYRAMAESGLMSTDQLEVARIRAGAWVDYPDARAAAVSAGAGFAALGDAENHQQSVGLIDQMDASQLQLVLLLGALALLTIAWLVLWLRYRPDNGLKWDGQD